MSDIPKKIPKRTNPLWLYFTFDFPEKRASERFKERFGVPPETIELTDLLGGTVLRLGPITDEFWNNRSWD